MKDKRRKRAGKKTCSEARDGEFELMKNWEETDSRNLGRRE